MATIHLTNFLTPPSTELSMFLLGDNQLQIANGVNLHWKQGIITKDLGYSRVGGVLQANKSITGLHNFRQSSLVQKILATVNNAAGTNLILKYNNAGTWTDITVGATWDAFEDSLVEMEDFIGYCFFVGYDATDNVFLPVASLTGTTFSAVTNVTNMPQAKYITRYRDRLYVANCYTGATAYPYRVYFSSIPVAGAITWTVASDFLDVDFSEQITGITSNWDRLVMFTEFSACFYDGDSKKKVFDTGCINNRSIQNYEGYLIWGNKHNIWVSTGGRPTAIGNDIAELITNSTPANWRSAMVDDDYHLYLGATEANGLAYTNCLAVFNFKLGYWRWRELYDNVTALCRFTSGDEDRLYLGTTGGAVFDKAKYTDATLYYADGVYSGYAGKPIISHWRTKAYDFGDPSIEKTINKIVAYSLYGQGMSLRFRIIDRNNEVVTPFTDIGRLSSVVNYFDKKITGNFIQFEGKEYSSFQPFEVYGLSIQLFGDSKL